MNTPTTPLITFVGGGNMASAIVGGLLRQGHAPAQLQIVEPWDEQRARLAQQFPGVALFAAAGAELQPSDLVIIAARPSMGKTAFVLNIAQHSAIEHNVPIAIFSLEMSKESLVLRLLTSEARIDSRRGAM